MQKKWKGLLGVTVALVLPWTAGGTVLVHWGFGTDLSGTIVDTTGSVASVANATPVGSGGARFTDAPTNLPAGGGTGTGLDYIAPYAAGTAVGGGNYRADGFGTAPSATSYASFSLTMGATIDPTVSQLEGVQFNLATGGATTPRGVEVTYRIGTIGGFTSLGTTATPNNTASNYGLFTFNLGSPATISAGDVIEFRFLGYAPSVFSAIRLDEVSITAIPEPSAWALLVGALGCFFFLRRCRVV